MVVRYRQSWPRQLVVKFRRIDNTRSNSLTNDWRVFKCKRKCLDFVQSTKDCLDCSVITWVETVCPTRRSGCGEEESRKWSGHNRKKERASKSKATVRNERQNIDSETTNK